MSTDPEDLSVGELQELIYRKKRARRQSRLTRLKGDGRVVEVDGVTAPDQLPSAGKSIYYQVKPEQEERVRLEEGGKAELVKKGGFRWRWIANKLLLFAEIGAVVGLIVIGLTIWGQSRQLNKELAAVQQPVFSEIALPTREALIKLVVLPSGHKPPVEGRLPEPGEAGNIPAHLQPLIDSYVPPPIPTPSAQQARRIQIPTLDIDKPIVQGDSWEQLKKGVGQHIGGALPGEIGNLVLSAHNDIYGEIFRHLDKLAPGDEILVSTERESFRYIVRELKVVDPTDTWVMEQTDYETITLISCYPYLVNNKRIIVFADLANR